jgi:hypothetical protein
MQSKDLDFEFGSENEQPSNEPTRQQSSDKQYRAKRSAKPSRRRVPKAAHPGYGMSGRRHRRWTW